MANFKVFRETALPGTLEPYSMYLIAPPAKPNHTEIYVTGSTASTVKRVINEEDVAGMINSSIAAFAEIKVVADIEARDALTPTANKMVMVLDATDDETVDDGAATYIYQVTTAEWIKISEAESMDVILDWANIENKPTSSVSDIDDAVAKRHEHSNKTQLDKIGEDGDGHFTYNGSRPVIDWNSIGW